MSPSGDVFTCNGESFRMGNLNRQTFDQVWKSLEASNARACAHYLPGRLLDGLHGADGGAPRLAASAALGARPLRHRRPLKTEFNFTAEAQRTRRTTEQG